MKDRTFELGAGALCLDLANTWGGRPDPSAEKLQTYRDLVGWARDSGSVTPDEADSLIQWSHERPSDAALALKDARALREAIYRTLSARAAGGALPEAELERLNRVLARAMARLRLEPGGTCCGWCWDFGPDDLDRPLWPAVRSAAELLVSDEIERLHECEASDCSWLFIDRSRGRRRRWCDMATCGNREKARRHYQRMKAAGG